MQANERLLVERGNSMQSMQSMADSPFQQVTAFFELVSLGFATIGVRATLAALASELLASVLRSYRLPIKAT
jgi:hypothetical protein